MQVRERRQPKKQRSANFRGNMIGFNSVLADIKHDNIEFAEKHIRLLQQTPFWTLFNAYHQGLVLEKFSKKSDKDVLSMIKCYGINSKSFRFRRTHATLTPEDVTDILAYQQEAQGSN